MKKLLVIGIVAAMVMGLAVAAGAALDTTWAMQLRAYNGTLCSGSLTLRTIVGAIDGYTTVGSEDAVFAASPIDTYGELISNLVPAQRTSKDARAPLLVGQTKVWDLSMYIVGGAPGTIRLDGWMATGVNMLDHSTGGDPDVMVQLFQVGNPVALWTVPYGVSGTSSSPTFTQTFAYDGTPISLQLVASSGPPAIVRVSTVGVDSNDGSTWALAKKTVQAGIDAANPGGEVWVAAGTYVERITLKDGVGLYGGFAGTETDRSQRNWSVNVTILDGSQGGSVVTAPSGLTASARIDGFTIRNGNAFYGGGVCSSGGSPTISNNTISGNTASGPLFSYGGGIYCNGATVSNNTITGNTASGYSSGSGGGVCCGSGTISNNTISGNTASGSGSAAGFAHGGGIYCGSGTISNNTVSNNTASGSGSEAASASGGGIYSSGAVVNNIVAFNSSGIAGGTHRNNCVYNPAGSNYDGGSAGPGDISADPLFVAAASGNYHLSIGSPCIDAGDNSVVQPGWTDRDGKPRVFPIGGIVDMGCYESDQFWITIVNPTTSNVYSTTVSPLAISGTTTDNFGNVTGVTWFNDTGGSGACSGTASWSAAGIVLQPGINGIEVTASDDLGNTADVALTVCYYSVPSTVTITNPTSEPAYTTTDSAITLSGTSAGDVGTASVAWANSGGGSGTCAGTTSWSVTGITLQPGDNAITITSTDGAGYSVSASITVTRTPITIGATRQLPAGSSAFVTDAVVTAANIEPGSVFVESPGRISGIKLVTGEALSVGQSVQFSGTAGRGNGEYQVSNITFLDIDTATPLAPLGMTTKTLGNDLTETLDYVGMNTTGMLVRFAGKVTAVIATDHVIYVDDGFGYEDGLGPWFGIRVQVPASVALPIKNKRVIVTGISRVEKHTLTGWGEVNGFMWPAGTVLYVPSVWARDAADVRVL